MNTKFRRSPSSHSSLVAALLVAACGSSLPEDAPVATDDNGASSGVGQGGSGGDSSTGGDVAGGGTDGAGGDGSGGGDVDDPKPDGDFERPAGIYLLGVNNSVTEIRDYPFVDGYILRTGWTQIETAENVYNFTKIDQMIEALDAIDQKLSLTIFSQKVPQYLADDPTVETYEALNQNNNGSSYLTAAPWDAKALSRYQLMIDALGSHKVMSLATGTEVPLRDHPALSVIGAQVMGLGGVRDPRGLIAAIPSYTRDKFTEAAIASLQTTIDGMKKPTHVAFFGMADDNSSPPLDDHLLASLMTAFNGGAQPKLGLFGENLACDTPGANASNMLFENKASTFTMFQMLQAWQDPFQNAAKTDICNTANNGPDIGIEFGFTNFNTRYFEVYPIDLDFEGYWPALQTWHDKLAQL